MGSSQIIEQNHALSNPTTTKQIDPTLLSLESELQAHEDHLAHQFMGRVEAIERTRRTRELAHVMPLGHALRMMTHYDVEDFPMANETYQRWSNKGTFIEGKMYANFDLDTITVTAYFAEVMSPHQSTWEDLTYAQMGTYPDLNEDCVILAEDEALADFETSISPRAPEYPLIQNLDHLDTTRIHLVKCGGCHLLFPQAQIRSKLCEECRILTPDILHGGALRPQASLDVCQDCSEPAEFGLMCEECEEALLSAFEPQS